MPYIIKNRRKVLIDRVDLDVKGMTGYLSRIADIESIDSAGELNFVLTTICKDYIDRRGLSYGLINEVVGVLECAKLELYRRLAAPYEDKKIAENGDVY